MTKFIYIVSLIIIATTAQAAGPEEYKTLKEVKSTKLYNLTCSNTKRKTQIHVKLSVNNGSVDAVTILAVTPSKSVSETKFSNDQLAALSYSTDNFSVDISGEIDDGYFGQTFSLSVADGKKGLEAQFYWNDGDGEEVEVKLACGAINYVIPIN